MGIDDLLKGVKTAAVFCNQFGDTGKGKFSDYLASSWADVIARGTGGNNAGHTVVVGDKEKIFHLIPAGILSDCEGKITVLGNGMVIDLAVLSGELDELDDEGFSYNNLRISEDANVIMPYHIGLDKTKNQSQKNGGIGSTGRGIGPCYTDKIARRGIVVRDLFDVDRLSSKLDNLREIYRQIKPDEVIAGLAHFINRIKPFVRDTVSEMHRFKREGKKILLEGAQGLLLSIEHGTYPYVTSSDCSLNGMASGVGLSARDVDLPLGLIKFPFMTRVGAGPFPTELGGGSSEKHCSSGNTLVEELESYGIPHEIKNGGVLYDRKHSQINDMINSSNEFYQGIGIRLAAGEYGATTGRPRRVGWTDAVAAKYAVGINGPIFVLTKPDCLSDASKFNLVYEYNVQGKPVDTFSRNDRSLRNAKPVIKSYEGYGNIGDVRSYERLPQSLKSAIGDFERFTGGSVAIVSVGATRDQTIVR